MPITEYSLDESHFATFKWFTMEWARHFGVHLRWNICADWCHDPEPRRYASVLYSVEARNATVVLEAKYVCRRAPTMELLCSASCHEIIHVLLAPLADWAELGAPRGVSIAGDEHEVIQTLVQISMRDHFDTMRARCPFKV